MLMDADAAAFDRAGGAAGSRALGHWSSSGDCKQEDEAHKLACVQTGAQQGWLVPSKQALLCASRLFNMLLCVLPPLPCSLRSHSSSRMMSTMNMGH